MNNKDLPFLCIVKTNMHHARAIIHYLDGGDIQLPCCFICFFLDSIFHSRSGQEWNITIDVIKL